MKESERDVELSIEPSCGGWLNEWSSRLERKLGVRVFGRGKERRSRRGCEGGESIIESHIATE